jgi:hypothetical protein
LQSLHLLLELGEFLLHLVRVEEVGQERLSLL